MSKQDERMQAFVELMQQLPWRDQLVIHSTVVALSLCNLGQVDAADAAELRSALKAKDTDAIEAWLVQHGYLTGTSTVPNEPAPTTKRAQDG